MTLGTILLTILIIFLLGASAATASDMAGSA